MSVQIFQSLVGCIFLTCFFWMCVMYLSTISTQHIFDGCVIHASFPSQNDNKPSKNRLLAVTSGICSARAAKIMKFLPEVKQTTKPCMLCKGILLKWLHIQQPVAIFGLPSAGWSIPGKGWLAWLAKSGGWWFQIFSIFNPHNMGEMLHFDPYVFCFQIGWLNHQLLHIKHWIAR